MSAPRWRLRAALACAVLVAPIATASAQVCLGGLGKVEYMPFGFALGDFATLQGVVWVGGVPPAPVGLMGGAPNFAVSQLISTEIASAGNPGDYTIGRIRFRASANFPGPACPAPPASSLGGAGASRIDIFYSVDNGVTWQIAAFPASSTVIAGSRITGEALVDTLALGLSGNQLKWKAAFYSGGGGCAPQLLAMQVGYEGVPAGVYQSSDPIPVGNVVLRGSWETPSAGWPDRQRRGHFTAKLLYNPDTSPVTDFSDPAGPAPPSAWPIGDAALSITYPTPPVGPSPDSRTIGYNSAASFVSFLVPNASLAQRVLAASIRGVTWLSGELVYDFNIDGLVDDLDAGWLVEWVRGWANGSTKTAPKSWGLGPIVRSSPAVAGPPGDPFWLSGTGTPTSERNLYGTPCTSIPNTFVTQQATRRAVAIVGSQDGLFHGFDLGAFRWCDDPNTPLLETHGWFDHATARDYGNAGERWAYAPPGLMDSYRDQPPRSLPYETGGGPPRASADAAITLADACIGPPPGVFPAGPAPSCSFKTVMVATETRAHPYLTALDVTNPSSTPVPLWSEDWPPAAELDTTFQGTEASPSLGPVLTRSNGRSWTIATTSGISTLPANVYLYLIDLKLGTTYHSGPTRDGYGRVQLNVTGAHADCSGGTFGSAGSPVMVDSNSDGVIDRVYVADTKGCLYKVETPTMTVCPMASLGETVWAPLAVRVPDDVSGRVEVYAAGGDNPDAVDLGGSPAHFHLFGLEDDDAPGACGAPRSLLEVDLTPANLPAGVVHKVWTAPAINDDAIFVATSVGDVSGPCGGDPANPGLLLGYALTSTLTGVPRLLGSWSLGTNSGGGVHVYDGHLFANADNGTTLVIGRPQSWGTSAPLNGTLLSTPLWNEH